MLIVRTKPAHTPHVCHSLPLSRSHYTLRCVLMLLLPQSVAREQQHETQRMHRYYSHVIYISIHTEYVTQRRRQRLSCEMHTVPVFEAAPPPPNRKRRIAYAESSLVCILRRVVADIWAAISYEQRNKNITHNMPTIRSPLIVYGTNSKLFICICLYVFICSRTATATTTIPHDQSFARF